MYCHMKAMPKYIRPFLHCSPPVQHDMSVSGDAAVPPSDPEVVKETAVTAHPGESEMWQ